MIARPDDLAEPHTLPDRIVVSGPTGSGKTTLARELARRNGGTHIELDALFWEPGWTQAEPEVFRARALEATATEKWAACGNYSVLRDIMWSRAQMLVWLDYTFTRIAWQLFWRSTRRGLRREELWSGNRERLSTQFFTRDSLFLWLWKTYPKFRGTYFQALAEPQYAHLRLVRLRSPSHMRRWLAALPDAPERV